jgi:hypothetical protein
VSRWNELIGGPPGRARPRPHDLLVRPDPEPSLRQVWTFTINGTATAQVYKPRATLEDDYRLVEVLVAADTAPSGGDARFDILLNGTSIFDSDANKPTVASGANSGSTEAIATAEGNRGDYLQVECEVANGIADVVLQVVGERVG